MNAPLHSAAALSPEQTRERLGSITRQLHEAIVHLGLDGPLKAVADQIPDARDRLEYVGQMTERAAHKVLGLVEEAQPACEQLALDSLQLGEDLQRLAQDPQADAAVLRTALQRASDGLERAAQGARRQQSLLSDVMMTQDFQDLSGQVIKKVIRIISDTETHLLSLLIESDPSGASAVLAAPLQPAPTAATLQGPQVPDKALGQGDVDDLLASMGF
ncbi:MAG: protein phosphatase CheZ [Rubrivivax sp.]|nr:protein phosphatase CheZ [Rubrivivax sp.]